VDVTPVERRASSPPVESEARQLARALGEFEKAPKASHGNFVKVPIQFWDCGFLPRMKRGEIALFLAVLRLANFRSDRRIEVRSAELCQIAGISPRSFWQAIRKLNEANIVKSRILGKGFQIIVQPGADWQVQSFQELTELTLDQNRRARFLTARR
jgi:hypothetical protein